jgi:hypothetical protein
MRTVWPVQPREQIVQDVIEGDRVSLEERVDRIERLRQEFGPPTDIFLLGGLQASWALQEMQSCYITGNSMAVVFVAQSFIEHSLAGSLILSGFDDLAESGFAKIVQDAKETGAITLELFDRFDQLRRIRNSYVHPAVGFAPNSVMGRLMGSGLKHERELPDADAWYAIETVVDFIRHQNPEWKPLGVLPGQ